MRVGLALGGGGARALAHIGVIKVLSRLGLTIDCIAGTSMGAIIGALYALNPDIAYAEAILRKHIADHTREFNTLKNYTAQSSIEEKKLFLEKVFIFVKDLYLWNLKIVKPYLVDPKPFFRIMRELLKNNSFNECKIPFCVVAVDLKEGEAVVIEQGSLFKAVVASSALPVFFPPAHLKNRLLVDGGVLMPLPAPALRKRADFIIGVGAEPDFQISANTKNALDILFAVDRLRYRKLIEENFKTADFLLTPAVSSYMWSDFDNIDTIIKAGEIEMEKRTPELLRALKKKRFFSAFDIRRLRPTRST